MAGSFSTSAPENRWYETFATAYASTMNTTDSLPPVAEMQRAYLKRDAAFNGIFYLGVRTTGIFCRPTCPARKPRPENVEYFATAREAVAAGFRPCKRCRPMQAGDEPAWCRQLLNDIERQPQDRIRESDLASRGIDPATVRRYFQRNYGMTFHAYARARRLAGTLQQIREGMPLDSAVFTSGFNSHSGFRDAFARTFGSTPGKIRGGDCVHL